MSFGNNLQFLRKMHNRITQEELAEKLGVSRQTISKWEQDLAYPEIEKMIDLCQIFSCTMDQLVREEMNNHNEAFSDIFIREVEPATYIQYAVISCEPEDDAISHMKQWAEANQYKEPDLIGWDFPYVSQEQINVYHMHGYTAAIFLPKDHSYQTQGFNVMKQRRQNYIVLSIREPFRAPFVLIPNAYKTLMYYMKVNGMKHVEDKEVISCFEREYTKDEVQYMDIYIAVEM